MRNCFPIFRSFTRRAPGTSARRGCLRPPTCCMPLKPPGKISWRKSAAPKPNNSRPAMKSSTDNFLMKTVSIQSALPAAVKAARAAGKIMRANWHKPKRVNSAEAHDIKLGLDVQCQELIEKLLRRAFPEIPVLGEEGISGDMNAEYRWVVDPIDGTVNYFFGMPHAAVSIALEQ